MGWGGWDKPISDVVTLNIPLENWTDKLVTALKIGDLAVISFAEDWDWLVVHVPTLTRFDNAIPDGNYTEEELLMWVWKVQQDRTALWEALRDFNNSNYKKIDKSILNELQDYCLSVAVK